MTVFFFELITAWKEDCCIPCHGWSISLDDWLLEETLKSSRHKNSAVFLLYWNKSKEKLFKDHSLGNLMCERVLDDIHFINNYVYINTIWWLQPIDLCQRYDAHFAKWHLNYKIDNCHRLPLKFVAFELLNIPLPNTVTYFSAHALVIVLLSFLYPFFFQK